MQSEPLVPILHLLLVFACTRLHHPSTPPPESELTTESHSSDDGNGSEQRIPLTATAFCNQLLHRCTVPHRAHPVHNTVHDAPSHTVAKQPDTNERKSRTSLTHMNPWLICLLKQPEMHGLFVQPISTGATLQDTISYLTTMLCQYATCAPDDLQRLIHSASPEILSVQLIPAASTGTCKPSALKA